jgi:hypothetical protein
VRGVKVCEGSQLRYGSIRFCLGGQPDPHKRNPNTLPDQRACIIIPADKFSGLVPGLAVLSIKVV